MSVPKIYHDKIRQPLYADTIPKSACSLLSTVSIQVTTDYKKEGPYDLFVIGAKSVVSTSDIGGESTFLLDDCYDPQSKDCLLPLIKKKSFTGAAGCFLTASHKTDLYKEIGVVGFGTSDKQQYTILDGFDLKPYSAVQEEKLDTALSILAAGNAGKTLADAIKSTQASSVCFSIKAEDITPLGFQKLLETLMITLMPDERFKSSKSEKTETKLSPQIKKLFIHIIPNSSTDISLYSSRVTKMKAMVPGIIYARELGNTPANICTTESLAKEAIELGKLPQFDCKILGEKECCDLKMGAYLAVHAGSKYAPQFIHLTYKSTDTPKKKLALVGKGICMDTGGYNLKILSASIECMKFDMCAAAGLLGAAKSISILKPKSIEVHFIIPAAENMINSTAIRPGDIVTASNGTTIEIGNTDAEGRLTLCDALVYAETQVKPDCIIDCATLTGASIVGLGADVAALYGTADSLTKSLLQCAKISGTSLWPMPLYEPYRKQLDSELADMNNVSSQRYGGSITAGLFLKAFVKKTPWCHLDMAGPAYECSSKLATGYGARLFTEFIMSQAGADDTELY